VPTRVPLKQNAGNDRPTVVGILPGTLFVIYVNLSFG
jgi:hypothetical protein